MYFSIYRELKDSEAVPTVWNAFEVSISNFWIQWDPFYRYEV